MKKVLGISLLLILVDQFLRYYSQYNMNNRMIGNQYFGITYRVNKGLYIYPGASKIFIVIVGIIFLFILYLSYYAYEYYCICFRESILVCLSYSTFIASIMGNVFIDRLMLGYVRDYIVTPIAIANLADILIWIAFILLFVEFIVNKSSRVLLTYKFRWKSMGTCYNYIIKKSKSKTNN